MQAQLKVDLKSGADQSTAAKNRWIFVFALRIVIGQIICVITIEEGIPFLVSDAYHVLSVKDVTDINQEVNLYAPQGGQPENGVRANGSQNGSTTKRNQESKNFLFRQ